MDFIEGLPCSQGMDIVLIMVDHLTKYAYFVALRHPFTASTIVATFVKEIVRLHRFPSSIVSDRDKIFLSTFLKELFRLQGTQLNRSTAYHPQSDGQSEIVNKCLETYLRCFINEQPHQWTKFSLHRVVQQYIPTNFNIHDFLHGLVWEGTTTSNSSRKRANPGGLLR